MHVVKNSKGTECTVKVSHSCSQVLLLGGSLDVPISCTLF